MSAAAATAAAVAGVAVAGVAAARRVLLVSLLIILPLLRLDRGIAGARLSSNTSSISPSSSV